MHKLESVLENEVYKILCKFETQMDHLILARRPDLVVINKKKKCCIVDFAIPVDDRVKIKENKKIDKYWDLARGLKSC